MSAESPGREPQLVLSLVIPVYASAAYLEERLGVVSASLASLGVPYEIIAVDDGSRDGSAEVLRSIRIPHLTTIHLTSNRGKFGALKAGVDKASGACIAFTDADAPYDLAVMKSILGYIVKRDFHVVVGDRTLPASTYSQKLTWVRGAATRAFTLFVRLLVTGGLHDTQAGLKAFRGDVAKALFSLLREEGFSGDVEVLYIALKYNLEIRRVPVRLTFHGNSSVRPVRDGARMGRALLRIRANYRKGLYESAELRAIAAQNY